MDDEQEEYSDEDYRTFLLEGASLIAPTAFRIPPARCNCEGKIQLLTEEVSKLRDTLTVPRPEPEQTWPVVTGGIGVVCVGLGFLLGRWIRNGNPNPLTRLDEESALRGRGPGAVLFSPWRGRRSRTYSYRA